MNFYTEVLMPSPAFTSIRRVAFLGALEPITRAAVVAILAESEAAGQPLMVFETYRSKERQRILYAQGATQLKDVGVHHYGLACDLVKNVGGEPSWKGDFSFLGPLAKRFGLVWGGDWGTPMVHHSFLDADHVQRINVADQDRLFAGLWYPDANYDLGGPRSAIG